MQYVRKSELIPMNINYIERYLRSYLQRFYNTFGTNDAKLPERAIFMPHFPTQCVEHLAAQRIAILRVQKPEFAPFLPSIIR